MILLGKCRRMRVTLTVITCLLEQPPALGRHEVVGGGEAAGGLPHQRHVARVPAELVNVVLVT